jgi:hypothetical protein
MCKKCCCKTCQNKSGNNESLVQKHGKWLINPNGYYPYCSECYAEPKNGNMTKFCPDCGAKMDEKTII